MASTTQKSKVKAFTAHTPKTRPRKIVQLVDTNLCSYDRTDPFLAFNVLRKLIGSLPSRIGGCQFKLTNEEHKLSMHLLTIVEPFVGNSPSRRTLTRQPNEILDSIVFHMDTKHDLLNLALSCQRLHGVIFPRHYDYRVIRCKVSSISVWNHLVVHRSLARNVRRLEILDERSTETEQVPRGILTSDTDLESTDDELGMHAKQERYLIAAMHKMTALHSFAWSCNHSPISIENVWPTLLRCGSLQQVEINDNLVFGASNTELVSSRRFSGLRDLKSIALQSTKHLYGSTKTPSLARVSKMLHDCPNLESLNIGYSHRRGVGYLNPTADDLFLTSRWPHLRALHLTNLRCSSAGGIDALSGFLSAHAQVEVLHLDLGEGSGGRPQLVLSSDSLPNLKELKAGNTLAACIISCPMTTAPRPLETVKGVRLSGGPWDTPLLNSLREGGGGRTVKRVELTGWSGELEDVKRFVGCVPKLAWLDLGKKMGSASNASSPARDIIPHSSSNSTTNSNASRIMGVSSAAPVHTNVSEWAAVLGTLPELTTFHGIKFFYEVSTIALSTITHSSSAPSHHGSHSHSHSHSSSALPASELSRVRKNENIASVLASKCTKLRRVDCWDDNSAGRAVIISRKGGDVRLEVRRVRV